MQKLYDLRILVKPAPTHSNISELSDERRFATAYDRISLLTTNRRYNYA